MIALPDREALFHRLTQGENVNDTDLVLAIFRYQVSQNPIFQQYLSLINVDFEQVHKIESIPFLPVQLYKHHAIQSGIWEPELIFESSSTTTAIPSKHLIRDIDWYDDLSLNIFESFFGPVDSKVILAVLPTYIERPNSSLVHMVRHFINKSNNPHSSFLLSDLNKLHSTLAVHLLDRRDVILWGIPFALLDLASIGLIQSKGLTIIETGGMKGRRKEILREELHQLLREQFVGAKVCSEYGMTELLSQAYTGDNGRFIAADTMQISLRQINDPLSAELSGKIGAINVIDLANLDTCSFIATDDLGRLYSDGSFEVLGRLDDADLRGCNLMQI
ncbi:MAG: acyl transferase [Saprospiraceae bacterium]